MSALRVLIIAEAANPEWESVPLVGWSLTRALADVVDVHLVTQIRNRDAIQRLGWRDGREFTSIDSERVAARVSRLAGRLRGGPGRGWTINTALKTLSYAFFERLVWRQFGDRIMAGEFDIVHRVTPLSPTAPSHLAGRIRASGIPFVLGPLNGGLPWPRQFDRTRRAEFEWLSYVRSAYKLLPGYRATRRHASAILIGSHATWEQMPSCYHNKCIYLPENAIDPARFIAVRVRTARLPIRVVFLGRLVPYKGPDMLLEAAAPLVKRGDMTLDIIGDGPLREPLRRFARSEGVDSQVRLTGWIEHSQVQYKLAEADLLAFPSIREFGGAVVLEAMAVGVVPLVVNYGGPAELVTPQTGYRVDLGERDAIVRSLRRELERVIQDPMELEVKSRAGVERVFSLFTWEAKALQTIRVYRWVLGQCANKPDIMQDDDDTEAWSISARLDFTRSQGIGR